MLSKQLICSLDAPGENDRRACKWFTSVIQLQLQTSLFKWLNFLLIIKIWFTVINAERTDHLGEQSPVHRLEISTKAFLDILKISEILSSSTWMGNFPFFILWTYIYRFWRAIYDVHNPIRCQLKALIPDHNYDYQQLLIMQFSAKRGFLKESFLKRSIGKFSIAGEAEIRLFRGICFLFNLILSI